jgi:hypothetical protein
MNGTITYTLDGKEFSINTLIIVLQRLRSAGLPVISQLTFMNAKPTTRYSAHWQLNRISLAIFVVIPI